MPKKIITTYVSKMSKELDVEKQRRIAIWAYNQGKNDVFKREFLEQLEKKIKQFQFFLEEKVK